MRAKILSASAGSGKTYRLAYKFVHDTIKHYNEKPYLYRAILAVTFTNKATEEMKSRIIKEFSKLINTPDKSDYMADLKRDLQIGEELIVKRARAILSKILHDYSRFTILTIDKFFQRILRAFIKELGIDINYNIELDSTTILARSTDSLIDDILHDEELQQWIMEYAQERMDDNDDWDMRKDMLSLGKELFNEHSKQGISQSLSKKELLQAIRSIEAVTQKSMAEMVRLAEKALEIMREAGAEPSYFSGKENGFIKKFTEYANGDFSAPTDTIRNRAASADGWVAKSKKPSEQSIKAQNAAIKLQPILARIVEIYDKEHKLYNSLLLIKKSYRSYGLLQDIYQKVGNICNQEGVMLLSETKYVLSQFISNNDAPFIYEKTGNRFERFMIDEFQDTSAREWANFVPLLQNAMSQSEDNSVLIVGDVKQSIYRWRGGDWRILQQGVEKALGQQDTELEILANNYRSLPAVVDFNNMAIEKSVKAKNDDLNEKLLTALESGDLSKECYAELFNTLDSAYKNHKQTAKKSSQREGYVRVGLYEEQPPLIECIESAIARGYSYGDIMILHRTGDDAIKSAEILLEYKKRNNAFNIMTQESLIIGKAPISGFVIALFRLSQDANDSISRALVNNYQNRPYDAELSSEEIAWLTEISQLSPEQAFEKIVERYNLSSRTEEIAYLQAIHEQIVAYSSSKIADIELFLKYWDETGVKKSLVVEQSDSTIELMTIHKSKGLEKKIIIIPYCSWTLYKEGRSDNRVWASPSKENQLIANIGSFPTLFNKSMGASYFSDDYHREFVYSHVDSINLLYVALTRACEELYVYIPAPKKRSSNNIGLLLWDALGQASNNEAGYYIEFGKKETIDNKVMASEGVSDSMQSDKDKPKEQQKSILIEDYPSNNYPIKLSLPIERYFEESADSVASLQVGILMHKILSEAQNTEQIKEKIEQANELGAINKEQADTLGQIIEREFENPKVGEWFGGDWDIVRCESDIIQSPKLNSQFQKAVGTLRPDRVMIKGNRAVVVDYKFGNITAKSHIRQMREYMRLIGQMGYSQIEGYVWYLTRSEIVQIEEMELF